MSASDLRRAALPLALFLGLALVPMLAKLGTESFILALMTRVVVVALAAMALDLLIGFGGLVSFGHAAFLGIGAYAVGILSAEGVQDGLVHLATAIAAAALFAAATGIIAMRTEGVHFIMITLAFGQMLYFLATALSGYGGDDGLSLPGRSRLFGREVLASNVALYFIVLGALLIAYLGLGHVTLSRFGRVLAGLRDNEVRMQAVGFRPRRFRLVAYVISGVIVAVAGVLLANLSGFVSPATMAWQRSGDLIFVVVLGGLGTLHGAILGALAFILLEEMLSHWSEHWRIVFGPLLVLAVLFARGGLAGWLTASRVYPPPSCGGEGRANAKHSAGVGGVDTNSDIVEEAEPPPTPALRPDHVRAPPRPSPPLRGGRVGALLTVESLCKSYGALRVTDGVSFDVAPGELHALIGPNGAGKTTLIHLLSGMASPDGGHVVFAGGNIGGRTMAARAQAGLARSFQITSILPRFSVLANVAMAVQARSGSSFRFVGDAGREGALNDPAFALLERFGLAERAEVEAGLLSHGEKRVLEIAVALATSPRLLLLDEPLAGTSHAESRRLVTILRELKGSVAILLVEHDMEAVFALADRVSVLAEGRLIATGPPAAIRADPAVRAAYLGDEAAA